jgi:hypothetical protein
MVASLPNRLTIINKNERSTADVFSKLSAERAAMNCDLRKCLKDGLDQFSKTAHLRFDDESRSNGDDNDEGRRRVGFNPCTAVPCSNRSCRLKIPCVWWKASNRSSSDTGKQTKVPIWSGLRSGVGRLGSVFETRR